MHIKLLVLQVKKVEETPVVIIQKLMLVMENAIPRNQKH